MELNCKKELSQKKKIEKLQITYGEILLSKPK
jgi:hypothetical protein